MMIVIGLDDVHQPTKVPLLATSLVVVVVVVVAAAAAEKDKPDTYFCP